MTLAVRRATGDDACAIAHVRIASWRVAYRGLIDQGILDGLDATREGERRAASWERSHADPRAADLVAELDGQIVGWAATGPAEDRALQRRGQVFAVYALPEHWGLGIGHALMIAAEDRLRRAGFRTAVLWQLDGNDRAARFYERHGWHEDGASMTDDRFGGGGDAARALHERRRAKTLG